MLALIRPANKEPGRRYGDLPVSGISTIRHLGNDYGWGSGAQVYAAAAGRVAFIRWGKYAPTNDRSGGYGNYILLDHGNGYSTLYAHLPGSTPLVSVGQHVAAHEQIAWMGNSGNASGVHLHFELRINGSIVDPNPYIAGTSTGAASQDPIVIAALPEPKVKKPMAVLIRNYDGSIGLVTDDGELVPLGSLNEVDSLKATGIVGDWVQMADGNVWNTLTSVTSRKLAQRSGSPDAVAAAIAPLLVPAILEGLRGADSGLTEVQVAAAAEVAIRAVFASAAK